VTQIGTADSTAELVHRAAGGEELAWHILMQRYGPMMGRVARTYRLGDAQTGDAVATAWLRLVEHIDTLRDGQGVGGWLVTTVRRECLAQLRMRNRERPVEDVPLAGDEWTDAGLERRLVAQSRRRVVLRAVARLPEQQQRLLALLFAEPAPSYREISARLALPIGSIGPTRLRILRKLRDILADDQQELLLAG
jgi:RNA polymerase sigma factor (sigma-70 family)